MERPKCLVEVGGQTILQSQLHALQLAGIDRAVVVGGYRFGQIASHVSRHIKTPRVQLVFNPFWAVSSSIGSVWAARDHLHGPFCILNGDTMLDPLLLRDAVSRAGTGVSLLTEPIGEPAEDDMRVSVAEGRVRAVSKDLSLHASNHRSLGVVLSTGDDQHYRRALDTVISGSGGVNAYHHDIIDHLARESLVSAIVVKDLPWLEIDTPGDIDNWTHEPALLHDAI